MGTFRGIVGAPDGDTMRLYLIDREPEYVEFALKDVQAAEELAAPESPLPIHDVTIADDAVVAGTLDHKEFERLFDAGSGATPIGDWRSKVFALVEHQDARSRRNTQDGSSFRCCYSIVYK